MLALLTANVGVDSEREDVSLVVKHAESQDEVAINARVLGADLMLCVLDAYNTM